MSSSSEFGTEERSKETKQHLQLLAVAHQEEFEAAKNRLKEHQEGLLGSLWKYWLTDEDKQQIEQAASSVTSDQ